jgi:phage terminase large subunit-like protein
MVAGFTEDHCRNHKGPQAGELVRLMPWELELLDDLFEINPETGLRRYRRALIGIPRKNGKSLLCSAIALYLLTSDGEKGAEVYSCAGDKDQARIVFGEAKRHVESDPELSAQLKVYKDVIYDPGTGSLYKCMSAEAYTKEGLNPSGVIFDEVHVQPNRELYDVMTQGSGARTQPLVVGVTTAGYDKDSLCYQLYDHGKAIQEGREVDPGFFFRWWEPSSPKADHRDPAVWRKCNPALGAHLRESDMVDALQAPENVFRRYRLNQWVDWNTSWLPPDAWENCEAAELGFDPALPVRVAIDLSQYHDAAAVAIAQNQAAHDRIVVRSRIWENPYQVGTDEFLSYQVPVADLRNYLREIAERFPLPAAIDEHGRGIPGPEFAFDPWGMAESADILEQEKLNMLKFPQNESRMVPASSDFYTAVMEKRIAHDGDEVLARHVNAAVAKPTDRGWRLARPKGKRVAMDGAIAAGIAVHRALMPSPKPRRSAYEDRGLTSA